MTHTRNLKVVELGAVITIRKNEREEFRVSVREYGGYKLLNCHVWYTDQSGQLRPGKKDFSVRVERAREVLKAMEKVLSDAGF